jgi:hypothetical protein
MLSASSSVLRKESNMQIMSNIGGLFAGDR